MTKHLPIQLSIPKPCSENWDAMTPAEQGRFCAHCQKTVIDFTTWADKDLYQFFSKSEGSVCGRFFTEQLNRTIYLPPQPPTRLYRIAIALGLTLIFTQVPSGKAHAQAPLVSQSVMVDILQERRVDSSSEDSIRLYGIVWDASKQPAINAVVTFNVGDSCLSGTVTDNKGNYIIEVSKKKIGAKELSIKFQYAGYSAITITGIKESGKRNVHLETRSFTGLTEIIIIQPPFDPAGKTTIRSNDIKHMGY